MNDIEKFLEECKCSYGVYLHQESVDRLLRLVKRYREALDKISEKNSVVISYDPIHGEELDEGEFALIAIEALQYDGLDGGRE